MRLEKVLTRNTVFEVGDFQRFHINCYARLSNDYAIYQRHNERYICHRNPKNDKEGIVIGKYEVSDNHSRDSNRDSNPSMGRSGTKETLSLPDTPIDLDAIRRSGI